MKYSYLQVKCMHVHTACMYQSNHTLLIKSLNRQVLGSFLKVKIQAFHKLYGSRFHSFGAHTASDLSPKHMQQRICYRDICTLKRTCLRYSFKRAAKHSETRLLQKVISFTSSSILLHIAKNKEDIKGLIDLFINVSF